MDNPFDSKNEDALKDASLADGWQRYAPYTPLRVFGRSGCPEGKRPSGIRAMQHEHHHPE
jgi:hypothetical protein